VKIYISVDIEGVAGATHWDETIKEKGDYAEFRELMTREALAAIEGAKAAGATEILVKDAHSTGRNLILDRLPEDVRIVRAWAGHPLCMVQELDQSFDAVLMIGYHASAGSEANPLAHTLSDLAIAVRLNGAPVSEAVIHAYAAALHGVPVAFVSGDEGLCAELSAFNPAITTLGVKRGVGASTISMSPAGAERAIREGVAAALSGSQKRKLAKLPRSFVLEIVYNNPVTAYRMGFYPGAEHAGDRTIRFATSDYLEVLRMLNFVT
jgi:D-amino peptidase